MPEFEIVVLANSRKRSGRCVAGLRTDGGGWIRPVSWAEEGVLLSHHYTLPDKTEVRPLDVVRISCVNPEPKPHHPEDWKLAQTRWKLVTRPAALETLYTLQAVETPSELLHRFQRRVPYTELEQNPASASLALIRPDTLSWLVETSKNGTKRVRAVFQQQGTEYVLPFTDPLLEPRLSRLAPGDYPRPAAGLNPESDLLLTLSLSEPFRAEPESPAYCYTLVAAVIATPTAWHQAIIRTRSHPKAPANADPEAQQQNPQEEAHEEDEEIEPAAPNRPLHHGARWTPALDEQLIALVQQRQDVAEAARIMGRTQSALYKRIGVLAFTGMLNINLSTQFLQRIYRNND